MNEAKQIAIFSQKRLQSYENLAQHRQNFQLIKEICPKIGLLEIITRNKVAGILQITDDSFISKQTLGFWCGEIEKHKIHNVLVNLEHINFKKYSTFNKKDKLRNYQKVKVAYSLFRTMRNRAFHFENLYKRNKNGTSRLASYHTFGKAKILIGIDSDKIHSFLDDMIKAFDDELSGYLD